MPDDDDLQPITRTWRRLVPPDIEAAFDAGEALRDDLPSAQATALGAVFDRLRSALSDRLRAERALRRDHARFRSMFEHAAEAMFRVRLDGVIIEANPAAARMFGCQDVEDVLRRNIDSFCAAPDGRAAAIDEVIAHGRVVGREGEARRADGTTFRVRASASLVRDADGRPAYVDTIAEDISDRVRALQALRASEARLRLLLATSHDMIVHIDGTGVIETVNDDGMFRMTGRRRDEVVGHHFLAFIADDAQDEALAHFRRLQAEPGIITVETRIVHREGGVIPVSMRIAPILDADGAFAGAVGTGLDLSAHHELHERLEQVRRMQAVGQLAGGIAHDFNNQLAGIGGYAELLLDALPAGSRERRHAERIHTVARRGSALTRKLLTFARHDGTAERVVDLHAVVDEMLPLLELGTAGAVDIRRDLAARRHLVRGDPALLGNAVLNLLVNARDALDGTGTITVTSRDASPSERRAAGLAEGRAVVLGVADDGHGMDAATRDRAFDPFFTTKPVGTGTGIGLSTVYATVHAHGGTIDLDTAPGRGTRFAIVLPVAAEAGAASESGEHRAPVGTGWGPVLIAEDDPTVRAMLAEVLRRQGYTPTACADGAEAVRRFRDDPAAWRLVVLDLAMPQLGGERALAALRATHATIPVLVVSGNVERATVDRLEAHGARVLRKPFALAELLAAIDALLEVGA